VSATTSFEQPDGATLLIRLAGAWKLGDGVPSASDTLREIESRPATRRLTFESRELAGWDTSLVVYIAQLHDLAAGRDIEFDTGGLPEGLRKLLRLATAVPAAQRSEDTTTVSFVEQIGHQILRQTHSLNAA
jgi:phospholipid/cholesterol/gamma-HCH transport system permease protein